MYKTNQLKYNEHIIIIILICLPLGIIQSQVGINTKELKGVFHIDAAGDNVDSANPTVAQLINDVVISSSGEVGIGTIPNTNLHIKSPSAGKGLRIETPDAQEGAVLTSDANGQAYWDVLSFGNIAASWNIVHAGFLFDGNTQDMAAASMTDVVFENTIQNASASTSALTLPAGNYMLFFSGAILSNDNEYVYAASRIKGYYTGDGQQYFNATYYAEHIFSFADFFKFDKEVNLSLEVQLLDNRNNIDAAYTLAVVPPRTYPYEFTLTAVKLPF